ncbi:hypothetical protein [Thiolapillus sp.]|uniref:Nodulation protein E n=1 Tax=Thiolapillus brandeum TaxID=1076588 RepID=A0A831WG01_9GAMM|nr:hypothetical protein [Thiolapillus sp.]HEC07056.1 hypothetical protein [Thiolapillus brandeum]
MSLDTELAPHPAQRQTAISEEFAAYCAAEFERRQNSGEEFDEAAYREAMEMALTRLRQLEEEGLA